MTSPPVVVVGSAAWNTMVTVDKLPEPRPHTVTATSHRATLGGTSARKSLNLAALGVPVLCAAMVGDDADAGLIAEALTVPGVDTALVPAPGASEHHLNLMTPRGERLSIFLDHAPAATTESVPTRVLDAIASATIVVPDLMPLGRSVLSAATASPGAVWTDVHDYDGHAEYHRPFIDAADLVIMNDDGCADRDTAMAAVLSRGPRVVVCTLGAAGAVALTVSGTRLRVPAAPTDVVDANGAGDAFMAGMIAHVLAHGLDAARLDGQTLADAMRAGALAAAATVASPDIAPRRA